MTGIDSIWAACVRVMDALEKCDGDAKRANRFFCGFMAEKDKPTLGAFIEDTVNVVDVESARTEVDV